MAPIYEITGKTMAILPGTTSKSASKVLESDNEHMLTFKEKPFEIIEQNCIKNLSSYAGRRASVLHYTSYTQKTPVPVSVARGIIVFPTQGLSNKKCVWIFYQHVSKIVKKSDGSEIIFKDGTTLFLKISKKQLNNQLSRCKRLNGIIENIEENGVPPSEDPSEALGRILSTLIQKEPVEPQK